MAKPQAHKRNDGAPEVSKFPEGWILSRLAQLATDVQPGFACGRHTDSVSGVPHLRPMNVTRAGKIDLRTLIYVPKKEVSRDERWLRQGDVVFNNTNSPELVGKTACYNLPEPRAFSNHMTRIRCDARAVDSRFCGMALHEKWLRGHFESICNNHVSQASVGRKALFETIIPLPPLAEQKRIVAKVEALLARVDAVRERLAKVVSILKRFRRSVLAGACSGRLTADWREQHIEPVEPVLEAIDQRKGNRPRCVDSIDTIDWAIPGSWRWTTLGEIAEIVGGITKGQKRRGNEKLRSVPYLRVANVQRGFLDLAEIKHIESTEEEIAALRLVSGDVLFTEGGDRDKLGRGWVWSGEIRECIHQNHIFRARLYCDLIQGQFVSWFANLVGQDYFIGEGKQTVNLASINIRKLRALPVPILPAGEQKEVVRRVQRLLNLADAIEKRVAAGTARAEELTQSILAKAFRGELVPTEAELARREGREYESASALVAGLSAATAAEHLGQA
jgi:type I restriction enzyme S subunit